MLYDGFIDHQDREIANKVTGLDPDSIAAFSPKFIDERLKRLWILYKLVILRISSPMVSTKFIKSIDCRVFLVQNHSIHSKSFWRI